MSDWGEDLDGLGIDKATGEVDQGGAEPASVEPEPKLYYGSVDEFVREYLRHAYARRVGGAGGRRWAAAWWKYDEAVIRLEALWRSWEHLRQDPATGMSVWWRDHADHHMAMLMDPDGPFFDALDGDENKNKAGEPLPYAPPPDGMFWPEPHVWRPLRDQQRDASGGGSQNRQTPTQP